MPGVSTDSLREWIDSAVSAACESGPPLESYVHGIGTDVEHDLIPLWSLTVAARPRVVLELGTRHAVSTRTLAHACQRVGAVLFTCDPDPGCAPFLRGVPAVAFRCTGERLWEMGLFPPGSVDVLFIDTDPHGYEQTQNWCATWVAQTLAPLGIALFHDINGQDISGVPRPDIRVADALEEWVMNIGAGRDPSHRGVKGWEHAALGHESAGGLGVLRRRG